MTESEYKERWHLSKAVPVSIIFFLALQTLGIVAWAVRLDYRVQVLESTQAIQDRKIDGFEQIIPKLAVIEDRQINMERRVDIQTTKLDQLLGLVGQKYKNP